MDFLLPDKEKRSKIKGYFSERYPKMTAFTLGKSILGEDLELYKLGEGNLNVIYVGAHHGTEHITASLLYEFIDEYERRESLRFGVDPALLSSVASIYVIPLLNPDGVELAIRGAYNNPLGKRQSAMAESGDFSRWQANARGVDLNHNYDAGFTEYKAVEIREGIFPGRSKYSGEYPESEPESAAMMRLVRNISPSLVVTLHSQGEEIYFSPRDKRCEKLAKKISELTGYKISTPEGTAAYGGLADYTGGVLGIPSFTLEVGRGENPLPESEFYRSKDRVMRTLFRLPTLV